MQVKHLTSRQSDSRIRKMSEVINGMSSVKSYGWEIPFFKTIQDMRNMECKHLARVNTYRALTGNVYFSSLSVASFASFSVYWATGGKLTVATVFSTLSLLQAFKNVFYQCTRAFDHTAGALHSSSRIESFLNLSDTTYACEPSIPNDHNIAAAVAIDADVSSHSEVGCRPPRSSSDVVLQLNHCSFVYPGKLSASPVLTDISFCLSQGELLIVVGPVGAGKSSLLSTLLGDMEQTKGNTYIVPKYKIAYCSQQPWIIAATVKANICMAGEQSDGSEGIEGHIKCCDADMPSSNYKNPQNINENLYKIALEESCLSADLSLWEAHDKTEIGARGLSISGGQKARVALARALYSDADCKSNKIMFFLRFVNHFSYDFFVLALLFTVFLLDDPLSAVDAHVGKDIFFGCILGGLRERKKSIVLVTQQVQYLPYADKILMLDTNGQQLFFGTYKELLDRPTAMKSMGLSQSMRQIPHDNEMSTSEDEDENMHPEEKNTVETTPQSHRQPTTTVNNSENPIRKKIVQDEDRSVGSVSRDTYLSYFCLGGILSGTGALLQLLIGQAAVMISDYWLRWWAGAAFGSQSHGMYLVVYFFLVMSVVLLGYFRAKSWFVFCLRASSRLHERSLWSILYSPLQYFVANPTGRILNRFTKDLSTIETALPDAALDFLQIFLFCIAALVLIIIAIPLMLVMVPFILFGFIWVRRKYMGSAREIKRIDGVTKSPILVDLSAAVEGLATLKAYCLKTRITDTFHQQLDENGRVWFSLLIANRWLGIRLDCGVNVVIATTVFLSCFLRKRIDVGLLGFALVYALSVTALFQWCIRQSAEVENHMTSVERLLSFARLPSELGYRSNYDWYKREVMKKKRKNKISKYLLYRSSILSEKLMDISEKDTMQITSNIDEIHHAGTMEICNLTVRYREDFDPVLRNISLSIPGGSKVGICGRTGSGKSSLLLSILRMNIIEEGHVKVDGKSLMDVDLETVRSMISIIPQDAHLFSGTVRYNLDPFSLYTDEDLWSALESAHIKSLIAGTELGLYCIVSEAGNNFSSGQRQLISLARCILRRSKIVLMDEVTSNIDYQLDGLIQDTIRNSMSLKDATIITVAHRVRTIADADVIAVIDNGVLVETGSPQQLLNQHDSLFKSLAEKSGEIDDIYRIAFAEKECIRI